MSGNQYGLLRERRFRPLFVTQFLGAFNDNVFKTALITLVTFRAGQLTELDGKTLATLLPGLFILPFFLFSATSGQLADKFEKSSIARAVKIFEIAVMVLAAWGEPRCSSRRAGTLRRQPRRPDRQNRNQRRRPDRENAEMGLRGLRPGSR